MSYRQSNKQDTLVSGTNIKTINTQSLLGSGNITISGATLADGDYGDITVGGSGTTMTIDNSTVTEAKMSLADNTTNDVSTTKHGFAPKAPNDTTKFLRGDATWAAPTDPAGWTIIVKSANQDVTGSTFTDDTELQFSVVAGGNYMLELHISTSGNSSTDDYKFQFLVSTGTMIGGGNAIHRSATSAATNTALTATSVAATTSVPIGQNGGAIPTSSGVISAVANYAFRASADATFKLQFACNSGTTSVARTWKGSIMRYKRLD